MALVSPANPESSLGRRFEALAAGVDWSGTRRMLDEDGYALVGPLLSSAECRELIGLYADEARFRKRVEMARLRFGLGEYKYFAAPLPPLVEALRIALYRRLAPIANDWMERLREQWRFPGELSELHELCRSHGQSRPTPLMLRYEAGGYNCLHQDLYGELAFPLQVTVMLSRPRDDFEGGEFLLVEQRPRAQSRGEAIDLATGQAVIFATSQRPVAGARGFYRVKVRHGVSRIRRGLRYTLGIIFHDAR